MKGKKLFLLLLFLLITVFFGYCGKKLSYATETDAAETDMIGNYEDVGAYQDEEGGYSHVGVIVRINGFTRNFVLDTWKKENGQWNYVGTNMKGTKGKYNSYMYNSSEIWLYPPDDYDTRFIIFGNKIRTLDQCSVILRQYKKGKLVSTSVEYSFRSLYDSPLESLSLFQPMIQAGRYAADGISYVYDVCSANQTGFPGGILVNSNGGTVQTQGMIYQTDTGYYLHSLPTVSKVTPGYRMTFLGWFSQSVGGHQYRVGDILPKNTVLYAHWKEEVLSYPVTCIDILGKDSNGEVLGRCTWKKEYGSSVSGADAGHDSFDGAYYTGCAYTGCSNAIVGTNGATVYRYFKPTEYAIFFDGNGATSGNMMAITRCKYDAEVTLTKNCFYRENKITLHPNGENAVCNTSELYVARRFLGWSLEKDGAVRYSDGASCRGIITEGKSVTLYAVWGEEKTTIENIPRRLGYQFAGWAESMDAQTGQTQFTVNSDMEIYAVWKPDIVKYQIEYYQENLAGTYELISSYAAEGYTDSTVCLNPETDIYQGFTLDQASSRLSGTVCADGSLILTAFFRRNSYLFSYDTNGGTPVNGTFEQEEGQKKYGVTFSLTGQQLRKKGFVFAGWSQDPDGNHTIYQPGETYTMQNHDVILYAVWTPVHYKISFESNAKEGFKGNMDPQTVAYGEEFSLPECLYACEGYEFADWNTEPDGGGKRYQVGDLVKNLSADDDAVIFLYAQWKPIEFTITYDRNETEDVKSTIGGVVPDTQYYFDKDCYASEITFHAAGYTVASWNTKADGTGISVKPGENIKGKLVSKEQNKLYAIWEANLYTTFTLRLYLAGEKETAIENITLYGRTDETVGEAIKRLYKDTLQGEEAKYFYTGYCVKNEEVLEERIQGNFSTDLILYMEQRTCTLSYRIFQGGQYCEVAKDTAMALQKINLPKEVAGIQPARYVDANNNSYQPNETLKVERDLQLNIQHFIMFYGESGNFSDRKEFVVHGKGFKLPEAEKQGYRFLGWYTGTGNYVGMPGDWTESVTQDGELFAKWSEPLEYQIIYETDDCDIRILEHQVTTYRYQEEVILPDSTQVWVANPYLFVGWYYSDDSQKNLITKIKAGEYGDKKIKALLVRKNGSQTDGDHSSPSPDTDNHDSASSNTDNSAQNEKEHPNKAVSPNISSSKTISQNTNKSKGSCFWYQGIKYQVTSAAKKKTVKLVAVQTQTRHLTIPGKVSCQKVSYQVTGIGKKAFYKKNHIISIVIPKTVIQIEKYAFSRMKKLKKITLGKSIQTIAPKAFAGDKNLKKVVVKCKRLKKAGKHIFDSKGSKIHFTGKANAVKKLKH